MNLKKLVNFLQPCVLPEIVALRQHAAQALALPVGNHHLDYQLVGLAIIRLRLVYCTRNLHEPYTHLGITSLLSPEQTLCQTTLGRIATP